MFQNKKLTTNRRDYAFWTTEMLLKPLKTWFEFFFLYNKNKQQSVIKCGEKTSLDIIYQEFNIQKWTASSGLIRCDWQQASNISKQPHNCL